MSKRFIACVVSVAALAAGCASGPAQNSISNSRVMSITETVLPEDMIDSMDMIVGWQSYTDKGAKMTLSNVPGINGQALKISYDMASGGWVAITKNINKDMSKVKKIKFSIMGEGMTNTVEMRFEDFGQSNFGILVEAKSNVGAWMTFEVPLSKFTYWWGKNQTFDWKRVKNLHIAISKKESDQGGSGKTILDQLEMIR